MAVALVASPIAAPDPSNGISPQFRQAAENMLQGYHAKELTKNCGAWPEAKDNELRKAEASVDKSKNTKAEANVRSLLYDYATVVEAWQAGVLWSDPNADCTPSAEYAAFFEACREAITKSAGGGAIGPTGACKK